jgi:LDH2 family malate/lactate/ureidoglycolate dehydrogenase
VPAAEGRVPPERLAALVEGVLHAWGMPAEHASIATAHILYADLHGIDSHGCAMLPHYDRLRVAGSLAMAPEITVVREGSTTALVDGGGGLGHVPADTAMKLAIAKSRECGVAAIAVRNSGHYGAAGAYAALAAEAGLIGVATSTSAIRAIVPTRGMEAMLGTNPIAFAAPAARNEPFLLDMATSTSSLGKLRIARQRGERIPAGWALDSEGLPDTGRTLGTSEPRLTPLGASPELGSHKGYGLAAAVEILAAVLPGVLSAPAAPGSGRRVGHFFLVLDPGRFRAAGELERDVDVLLDGLRGSEPADPALPVLVAGDPEHAARDERTRTGIPLTPGVLEELREVARTSGVPFVLDEQD